MSNLSVAKVQRKTKNDPWPTLSENFNSHPLQASAKQMVSNQSATLKLPASDLQIKLQKKKIWIQITQTRQNTRYKKERETAKQRRDVISLPKKCCGLER
jgi:hypothetical protein